MFIHPAIVMHQYTFIIGFAISTECEGHIHIGCSLGPFTLDIMIGRYHEWQPEE